MAHDPYKYFRIEALELVEGLGKGVLELEKEEGSRETVLRLLRMAHTLKGASRVVRQPAIGDLAHALEGVLAPYRDAGGPVPKERVTEVLQLVDRIAGRVAALDAVRPPDPGRPAAPAPEDLLTTVRVEVREMDALLRRLNQTSAQVQALRGDLGELERGRLVGRALGERLRRAAPGSDAALAGDLAETLGRLSRGMTARLDDASRALAEAQDEADQLRLLPAGAVFGVIERSVRDAAQTLRKKVEFKAAGHDIRLDAHVLSALREALLHVARNAVAHGVEDEAERTRAGKPPAGRVELRVERRGSRAVFALSDDGRGIDVEAVRAAARRAGLETASLGPEEVVRLILRSGVTTTRAVTEVSGRGIGMDAVRATVARLKGQVDVRTAPGRGTTFEIAVPLSLSSVPSLRLESGGAIACLPMEAILGAARLRDAEIARAPDRETILWNGRPVPFVPLADLLRHRRPAAPARRALNAVIVRAGTGAAAIGVEAILGTATVMVRPLPEWMGADAVVAGAALDSDGTPELVLDPTALAAAACAWRGRPAAPAAARPPVLVVDDSLTTRMLEQSILESSGYEVDLAVSGEEGFSKARQRPYGLFIVDVEMPGMDGFEFVRRAKADPKLGEIPAILVTSRSSDEDRRRGAEAGARAYVVKSEFDQGRLLSMIRGFIG